MNKIIQFSEFKPLFLKYLKTGILPSGFENKQELRYVITKQLTQAQRDDLAKTVPAVLYGKGFKADFVEGIKILLPGIIRGILAFGLMKLGVYIGWREEYQKTKEVSDLVFAVPAVLIGIHKVLKESQAYEEYALQTGKRLGYFIKSFEEQEPEPDYRINPRRSMRLAR